MFNLPSFDRHKYLTSKDTIEDIGHECFILKQIRSTWDKPPELRAHISPVGEHSAGPLPLGPFSANAKLTRARSFKLITKLPTHCRRNKIMKAGS